MTRARVILDQDFTIGEVDPRLFGGFAEHLGRHIYTGLYEPGHPQADELGFRRDVLGLLGYGIVANVPVGFRHVTLCWRLRGLLDAWRGKTTWEKFARVGFRTETEAARG